MKKLHTFMIVSLLAGGGVIAEETSRSEVAQEVGKELSQTISHQEKISLLRQAYERGDYDGDLLSLESDYQTLIHDGRIQEFISMRETPPVDSKVQELALRWESLHAELLQERNSELKAVCKERGEGLCQQVMFVLEPLSQQEQAALRSLSDLRSKTPDMAASDEERTLIEIDLATESKSLNLDAQHVSHPMPDRMEKQIVLKMDMLHKMQDASLIFKDESLKEMVRLANAAYDKWQAQGMSWKAIHTALKQPSGEVEKKIATILLEYKAKRDNLYQEEFLAKLESGE